MSVHSSCFYHCCGLYHSVSTSRSDAGGRSVGGRVFPRGHDRQGALQGHLPGVPAERGRRLLQGHAEVTGNYYNTFSGCGLL